MESTKTAPSSNLLRVHPLFLGARKLPIHTLQSTPRRLEENKATLEFGMQEKGQTT
jgi:hypothetical protein